ncbi:hypothetical protein [Bradyrhizobium ottawaense]|uniref:hypothetical protein n=1 Tax=Bradyrhizobium ottawaense TaxID=931866 RepID=UPI0030F3CC5B
MQDVVLQEIDADARGDLASALHLVFVECVLLAGAARAAVKAVIAGHVDAALHTIAEGFRDPVQRARHRIRRVADHDQHVGLDRRRLRIAIALLVDVQV